MQCIAGDADLQDMTCDPISGGGGGGEVGKRYAEDGCCQGSINIICRATTKKFGQGIGICKDIRSQIEGKYPKGSAVTCWFSPTNPSDFELELKPFLGWLIFSVVWLSMGVIVFMVWLTCAIRNRNKNTYQELK